MFFLHKETERHKLKEIRIKKEIASSSPMSSPALISQSSSPKRVQGHFGSLSAV